MATFARHLILFALCLTPALAVDYAKAADGWRKILAAEKEHVIALMNLGYCEVMLGNYASAANLYKQADALSENLDAKAGVQWANLAAENYGESIQWGNAALAIDPQNFEVRRRLAFAYAALDQNDTAERFYTDLISLHGAPALTYQPVGVLSPFYQQINFSGSSQKTSGFDTGAFALWNFRSGTTLGGGYARDVIDNPNSSDPYATNEFRLMSGFLFSDLSHLNLNAHVLTSNYSYLDKAVTLSATYRPGNYSRFAITADALIFPAHGGLSASPQYTFSMGKYFSLGLGGIVQVIGFSQAIKFYGAGQATLTFCASIFCLTGGALAGQIYTPVLDAGTNLIYSLDQLNTQAFAKLKIHPTAWLELSAAYTYGRWNSFSGETPVSSTFSFMATGSLW